MRRAIGVTAFLLLWGAPLGAQEPAPDDRPRIVLDETAVREVEQDTLVASFVARAEAVNPRDAQAEVNTLIGRAIEAAEQAAGVQRATGGYRVYQEWDREGAPTGWVAEQDLRLTTRTPAALLDLVGALQDAGLLLQGLGYELSREARDALEDELTAAALTRVQARARRVAETLGTALEGILTLRIGGVETPPPMMPRMMAMQADAAEAMPPPSALPDRETVSVRVEAEMRLERP